ncbi:hypothetical protein FACS1894219_09320 [Clostridia bacterium]|nr:hypothetical protein FACS1894219_09320 [Clostridia bacterium]
MKNIRNIKLMGLILTILIVLSGIVSVYYFRDKIYRMTVPNVETTSIGPMFINEK